jgi:glyoxylase-like metal-dependent hydrolase (beta-lactamase superfamily II)
MGATRPVRPLLAMVQAGNASPLTLDGTRTYLVGQRSPVIVDPGPALDAHMDAVAQQVGDGVVAAILITHAHPDHSDAAEPLARRLHAPVRAFELGTLRDGDAVHTDAGTLVALHTPGHRADHVIFHWPEEAAVFCGDLMMGGQTTALVATPEGNLTHYLESLARMRALNARTLYPAHGPPFTAPASAIDSYVQHREEREAQVLAALSNGPATEDAILDSVYGGALAPELRTAAAGAVRAYLEHLALAGRVSRSRSGAWLLA